MNTKILNPDALAVAGEMGERILGLDWSATPLGSIDTWSPGLRTTVSLMLHNRFPMLLWWTSDYISIYNDAYIPVLGDKHPWGLGKPVRECWSEIWHVLQPLIDSPFQGGPSTWMEDICLIINRNGYDEETHFTVAYSPAPDTSVPGGIGGVLATVNETTAQVINERAIETLRKTSSYLMGCRSEQEVLAKAAQAIGENKSDFPFVQIYRMDDFPTAGPARQALETTETVIIDDRATRAVPITLQGHQAPSAVMLAALNPYRRLDDPYRSFIQLVTDQIAQALANVTVIEAERRRAEAMAELDKAKTQFFSNISHEFRTPITLMLGPLEELLNKPAVGWSVARLSIETAYRNARRLLKLVNTLLEFSRIESGRSEARFVATDIAGYTRSLAANFRHPIEKAGLRFVVETGPEIPPVYLDAGMWEKIVFNLLSNAFKYTLDGSIAVRVSATVGDAVLTVTDTGVGIPSEELPKIFDRFHRVLNTRGRTFEGTGIGLSLIRELVQLHGGTIDAASAKDKGSSFTVRIPFGKAHLPAASAGETESNPNRHILTEYMEEVESLVPTLDGLPIQDGVGFETDKTILIVDDNADMRRHIRSVIGSRYPTVTASNGREALDIIRSSGRDRPSLVLSDLMMPVMDGGQLLRELKQDPDTEQIPVILITARAGEESLVDGFETGADDYLVKPFSGRELLSRINAQLRISQLRSQVEERLEKEVEARTLDLVKANKELEAFSYVTSHDLQEPLRKIQMFVDRILNENESAEKLLPKINASAVGMRQLIQSMLIYSRLSHAEPDLTDVDLGAVMNEVCQDFELVIEEKKAVVRIGKLPTVRANLFQMKQVFSNLLSNSLKFSGENPVIGVTENLLTKDNRAFHQICFRDSGIGFEPEYSKKIFELFQRLHPKHRYSGTGIGLSIVKRIIEQHNGYITAEPGEEGGAVFFIWLPAANERYEL